MFAFLHVPKTAGSTLKAIIESQHTRRWSRRLYYSTESDSAGWDPQGAAQTVLSLPRHQREAAEVLYGHFHFGVHRYLPQPTVYYTMLRDPLERAVSHYYYILEHYILSDRLDGKPYRHPDRRRVEAGELGLEEYVTSGYLPDIDNGQTRLLAGESGLYHRLPFGQCSEALLEEAKDNLKGHVRVVGLTEHFDESLLLIQRLCGWRTPYYVKRNVTQRRPRLADIPPGALAAIRRSNIFDQQLYDYGAQLFRERVAEQGPDFADQVRRFQRLNRRYGRLNVRWESVASRLRGGGRLAADRLNIRDAHRSVVTPLDSET